MYKRRMIIIPPDSTGELLDEKLEENENHLDSYKRYCKRNNIDIEDFCVLCAMGYVIMAYMGFTNTYVIYTPKTISNFQKKYINNYIHSSYKNVKYIEYQLCFITEDAKKDFCGTFYIESDIKNMVSNIEVEKGISITKKQKKKGIRV